MRNNNDTKFIVTYAAAVVIVLCVLAYVFTCIGCNTPRRADRLLDKGARLSPEALASKCAERYPSHDSVHERIVYKEGQTVTKKETQYVTTNCDSAVQAAKANGGKANHVKTPCPPCVSVRVDTVYTDRYIQEADRATKKLLDKANEDKAAISAQKNYWKWAACIAIGWIILGWIWKFAMPKIINRVR
jgi:hypothetical protein